MSGMSKTVGKGWDAVDEAVKNAKAGGLFLRLENDGESFTGCFIGDPVVKKVSFENARKPGSVNTRVSCNVAVYDPKTKTFTGVSIFDQGPLFFKSFREVMAKFPSDKYVYTVKRLGAKGDTKTTYSVLPDHEMTAAESAQLKTLELHDLEKNDSGEDSGDAKAFFEEQAKAAKQPAAS